MGLGSSHFSLSVSASLAIELTCWGGGTDPVWVHENFRFATHCCLSNFWIAQAAQLLNGGPGAAGPMLAAT